MIMHGRTEVKLERASGHPHTDSKQYVIAEGAGFFESDALAKPVAGFALSAISDRLHKEMEIQNIISNTRHERSTSSFYSCLRIKAFAQASGDFN